ncbi:MAG TPA: tetratricopeptide repeat protein [Ancylobacter sp.]
MRDEWISYTDLKRMGPEVLRTRISESPEQAARWVEAAALNGLINAQLAWGQMLVDGHGVARDPKAGLRWFRVAANAGSLEGINMVGRAYELGWGVGIDRGEAALHYRAAAARGHAWAQFNLATLLLNGSGVVPDRREALHWYARSARGGNVKAMTMIGRYVELGWDRPARPIAALRWYRRGAQGDDYRGQFDYARLLLTTTGRLDLALPWFERAVEGGVPLFCRQMAEGLREAPAPELRRIAVRALERAVETGEPRDIRAYAGALAEGLAGAADPDAARREFTRAREIETGIETPPTPIATTANRPRRGLLARFRRYALRLRAD